MNTTCTNAIGDPRDSARDDPVLIYAEVNFNGTYFQFSEYVLNPEMLRLVYRGESRKIDHSWCIHVFQPARER